MRGCSTSTTVKPPEAGKGATCLLNWFSTVVPLCVFVLPLSPQGSRPTDKRFGELRQSH